MILATPRGGGARGVPLFSVFFLLKIGLKTAFFGKTMFLENVVG